MSRMRRSAPILLWLATLFLTLSASHASAQAQAADPRLLADLAARQALGVRLLDGVAKALPELAWLDRLTCAEHSIEIEGRAFNTRAIGELVTNLDRLAGFGAPTLRNTEAIPDSNGEAKEIYRFQVQLETEEEATPSTAPARLSTRREEKDTLQRLRRLFADPGLVGTTFETGAVGRRERGFDVQTLRVRVAATTFHQAALLFDRLSRFPRLVALRSLALTPLPERREDDPHTVSADLTLEILLSL